MDREKVLAEEHRLDVAREFMRSNMTRLQSAGYLPIEIDDLAESIDRLIAAHVARSLRVHCDADHNGD
jgi:hypothetical protein